MNQKLADARGKVDRLRKELADIMEQAGQDMDMSKVTLIDGDSATKVAYMRALDKELNDSMMNLEPLEKEHSQMTQAQERLKQLAEPRVHPGFPVPQDRFAGMSLNSGQVAQHLPLGKVFYDGYIKAGRAKERSIEIADFDTAVFLKTTFATTAGWAPPVVRTGRFVEDEQRPIQVLDVVPSNTTTAAAVVYMEETTFTNAAAEVAEAGTYAEAALALTEQTSPVRKIAVFIPVTDEQLEDVPQVQGYLNNRMPFMLRQRLDSQIIAGNGTAPNLRGIVNVAGIQTQARGTDPVPDAIYKAMVKVRVTGRSNPSAIIVHPTDWQNVRLLRTADGLYIWGNPSEQGVERMWGLPVVQAEVIGAAGTALVGDFATYYELVFRRGIELKVTDSHQDFFIKGTQVIRADVRAASVVYRPAAFATVTGL